MSFQLPKHLNFLYSRANSNPMITFQPQKTVVGFQSRVYDITNCEKQGIKKIYIQDASMNFLYKISDINDSKEIIVLGVEYCEDKEFDLAGFSNQDTKTVQVLVKEVIDLYQSRLHAEICEKESLRLIQTGLLFEQQEGGYKRYKYASKNIGDSDIPTGLLDNLVHQHFHSNDK